MSVVYFDQQMGALHAVYWSKLSFLNFWVFHMFFHHKVLKNKKRRKGVKYTVKGVLEQLDADPNPRCTPKQILFSI